MALIRLAEPYYLGNVILMVRAIYSKEAKEKLLVAREFDENEKSYNDDQDQWNNSLLNLINSKRNTRVVKHILIAVSANLSEEIAPNQLNEIPPEAITKELLQSMLSDQRVYERDDVVDVGDERESVIQSPPHTSVPRDLEEKKFVSSFRLSEEDDDKSVNTSRVISPKTLLNEQLITSRIKYSWEKDKKTTTKSKNLFKVIEFAPKIFEYLRKMDGIGPTEIQT